MAHTFKVGDKGKTRGGAEYRVTAVGEERLLAYSSHTKDEVKLNLDGTHDNHSVFDLRPPKQRLTGWVNVYLGGRPGWQLHETRQDADNITKGCERIACKYIDIEYEEGEGL